MARSRGPSLDHPEDEQPRRRPGDRRCSTRPPAPGCRSTSSSGASAASSRASPGCRTTSGSARSWAATSSTAASTGSPTDAAPACPPILIGSADLMPRNLDRRVEALVPVDEPDLQARLDEILEVNLADDTLAWSLDARRHLAPRRRRAGRRHPPAPAGDRPHAGPPPRLSRRPERWRAVHAAFTFVSFSAPWGLPTVAHDDLSPVGHLLLPQGGHPLLKKKRFAWLALLLAFGLVAAACGDDDDTTSDDTDRRRRQHATGETAPPTSRARSWSPARPPSSPSPPRSARSCSTAPASRPPSTVPAPATASSCSAPARPTSPTPPVRSTRTRWPPARRPASSSSSSRWPSTASPCSPTRPTPTSSA